jgi:hypothetical protein
MRGQGAKRANDGYGGLNSKEYYDNLDVPTAIRKYNFDTDDKKKTADGKKDA